MCHYAVCHYAECHYAEWHYAVYHFAESHYANNDNAVYLNNECSYNMLGDIMMNVFKLVSFIQIALC